MKITPLVKVCILAAVGCGLYALWHKGVPRHKEEPEATGETEVAVHVGRISLSTLRHGVTAYGTVEPEPGGDGKAPASARIASPVAAIVSDVNCFEGQQVEKGQTLFTLNNSRKPDSSMEQALLKITAPLSGTVTYVNVRPGEVTDPEAPGALVELVDLSRLIVAANVPSSQLTAVKPGQTVEITASQNNARAPFGPTESDVAGPAPVALTGTVALVEDRVDPKTDMGFVDISVPTEARLRPGQFVRVRIITVRCASFRCNTGAATPAGKAPASTRSAFYLPLYREYQCGKKRAGFRRPFVVEACGALYGNIVTGPNGLNVSEPL